jgi:hypothetical protein
MEDPFRSLVESVLASSRKRQLPNRGQLPSKSIRREGNYRDSTLYNCLNDSSDDEDEGPLDEYEAYIQERGFVYPTTLNKLLRCSSTTGKMLSPRAKPISEGTIQVESVSLV